MEAARLDQRIDLGGFEAGLHGRLIRPFDPDYDEARAVRTTLVDAFPAAIVAVADAHDVARSVAFARDWGFPIAVRSGGHSFAGHGTGDGALVIDTSGLKGLHLDPEGRTAWAGAGLTAGEYTAAAAEHGLVTPFGDSGSVGLGGLTTGGGIGWLARKHGLTIDALLAVEVVTADGRIVVACETEHADLFWAVRGGGGNVGIVTRFKFRLFPLTTVLGGQLVLPATREVLAGLGRVAAAAPDELTTIAMVMPAPRAPFIPEADHGRLVTMISLVWSGDPAAGEAAIAPLRTLATPIADTVAVRPYLEMFPPSKGSGRGASVIRAGFFDALDDATIDTLLAAVEDPAGPRAMVQIRILGGAMGRVPVEGTAFAHRTSPVFVAVITPIRDRADAARHTAWTQAAFERLRPRVRVAYANFLGDEGDARVREAYPGGAYERLADVKRRYDPTNLFRLNQNVRPAARFAR